MLLSKIILLGELSSFLTEIPSFMHNYPGRRIAAYGRAIQPANTCGQEQWKQDKWVASIPDKLQEHLDICNQTDSKNWFI